MHVRHWALLPALFLALAAGGGVYTDNVVVVLDCSGSMHGRMRQGRIEKLDAAKAALKEVVQALPSSTHVGLLVFGGRRPGWVYPLGARDDNAFLAALHGLDAGGGTPLGQYMKLGADRLLDVRRSQYGYGSYRLLVVTDGQATDGNLVHAYTPDILSRGIAVDVIGVDMAEAHTLAKQVNSYRRANDPAALQRAIREVFAEVGRDAGGDSGAAVFGELEGFPAAAAAAILGALSTPVEGPIGNVPAAPVAAVEPPVAPSPAAPSQPRPAPPAPQRRSRRSIWPFVLAAIVIFSLVRGRRAAGGKPRSRR